MMVTLLLYAYCVGVYSSRRIQKLCERDAAYRVIVGDDVPNFRTISDFRKDHLKALQGLFVQVLQLCREAGLTKVGLVSLDGTKVKANASRHKAMSYEYMQKEEQRLQQEIGALLAQAESTDASEDDQHGREARGDELPAELARRESRLAKIREAKQALEEQALAAAQAEEARRQAEDDQRREAGETPRARKPVDPTPAPKAQRNFTDPESKIMKVSNKGFDPAFGGRQRPDRVQRRADHPRGRRHQPGQRQAASRTDGDAGAREPEVRGRGGEDRGVGRGRGLLQRTECDPPGTRVDRSAYRDRAAQAS
jgi:hypothetical protein